MSEEYEYRGYRIEITAEWDDNMGEPWKEHDGHGIVSEWTTRDKAPGEWLLCQDHSSKRFYDYKGTLAVARLDGWGLSPDQLKVFGRKLGRKPTRKEITAEAVKRDYEYLRAWCNDEWHWMGYTTRITPPDGGAFDGDSCWGFDDEDYMIECAKENAEAEVDQHSKTLEQTAIA